MTRLLQKNQSFKLFDAVTPSNALESEVFALPALATVIGIIASLATPGAAATSTVTIMVANDIDGPFEILGSTLVPTNADTSKLATVDIAYNFIKAVLSSVTVDGSTLTVTVNPRVK